MTPFLLYKGVKALSEGGREQNLDLKLEGAAALVLGVESAAASLALGARVLPDLSEVGEVAGKALVPLALVHGGLDLAIGGRHWAAGERLQGALEMGFGASVIGAAVGGGIPCLVAAGGCVLGKLIHSAVREPSR